MVESLKHKTIKGLNWSIIEGVSSKGITFIIGILLARVLLPSEYGLIAIALAFLALFNCLIDSGFSQGLIRKIDADTVDFSTVFFLNIVVSAFLYGILYAIAPLISIFFNIFELTDVLRLMGSILLIYAFTVIQRTILIKIINFKKLSIISISTSILSGIIGIVLAYNGFGVWSLVWQQITKYLFESILLWLLSNWKPSFTFSIARLSDLFSFGWKITVVQIIDSIWQQINQFVIGKTFSMNILGCYSRAEQFSGIISNNTPMIINRVTYPVLSFIQDNIEQLKKAYVLILRYSSLVIFILMSLLSAVSENLILVLIGERWIDAVGFLQVTCISGIFYFLHTCSLNILKVKGRSDIFMVLDIVRKIMLIFPIIIGIIYGIYFLLWGSVIVGVITYIVDCCFISRIIDYTLISQLRDLMPILIVSSIIYFLVYSVSFFNISIYILLFTQMSVGLASALILCKLFRLVDYRKIMELIRCI